VADLNQAILKLQHKSPPNPQINNVTSLQHLPTSSLLSGANVPHVTAQCADCQKLFDGRTRTKETCDQCGHYFHVKCITKHRCGPPAMASLPMIGCSTDMDKGSTSSQQLATFSSCQLSSMAISTSSMATSTSSCQLSSMAISTSSSQLSSMATSTSSSQLASMAFPTSSPLLASVDISPSSSQQAGGSILTSSHQLAIMAAPTIAQPTQFTINSNILNNLAPYLSMSSSTPFAPILNFAPSQDNNLEESDNEDLDISATCWKAPQPGHPAGYLPPSADNTVHAPLPFPVQLHSGLPADLPGSPAGWGAVDPTRAESDNEEELSPAPPHHEVPPCHSAPPRHEVSPPHNNSTQSSNTQVSNPARKGLALTPGSLDLEVSQRHSLP
jgi:hypothetical protein